MNFIGGYAMKPKHRAHTLLAVTRSKAKMYEYNIPENEHINIPFSLATLMDLAIGIIGDIAADFEEINLDDEKSRILFSATYFDAILNSKSLDSSSNYLKLLGASAYYLCDLPGSSKVLLKEINCLDIESSGIENLILSLLKNKHIDFTLDENENIYYGEIQAYVALLNLFFDCGKGSDEIYQIALKIRKKAYFTGSDRELLLSDILKAVTFKYIKTSSWIALPLYSGVEIERWRDYLVRNNSMKTLWPAQILLGEKGIFKGTSGIVQMPTSAGKTKSAEIIIRSSFLADRCKLAVIIAPFRALCQQIFNDMSYQFQDDHIVGVSLASDVMQLDIDNDDFKTYNILILTPEKLEYLLRQDPELASEFGLVIYDEGHLFDDYSRGVKYELLLSSLKSRLGRSTQVILISAVMPNPGEIGSWLLEDNFELVEAQSLVPTYKSIAFASWLKRKGELKFVNSQDIDSDEFFVPGVFEKQNLNLRERERTRRIFPDNKPADIAASLACRLVQSGTVAIFTGRKDSAIKICGIIVDAFDRGVRLQKPNELCDNEEQARLVRYIEETLGTDTTQYRGALLGFFIHHGSTPHGLRLATEYAVQKEHIKVVICTSTLAQGVNLPIRYLIVTTDRQGRDEIKVRDFHNLIGRAGRAGKYTEGTIIFTNTEIYDKKHNHFLGWRWRNAKSLLDPSNSEECRSLILELISEKPYELEQAIEWEKRMRKINDDINAYLISALADLEDEQEFTNYIVNIVRNTLAYHQADVGERFKLLTVFTENAKSIIQMQTSLKTRKIFAKSILNVEKSMEIVEYLKERLEDLKDINNEEELLNIFWPIIYKYNSNLPTSIRENRLYNCLKKWIHGDSFISILEILPGERVKGNRVIKIDNIVDICESGFGFDGSLLIGTCLDLKELVIGWEDDTQHEVLSELQRKLKYGLPDSLAIKIYNLGITDRALAQKLASIIKDDVRRLNTRHVIGGFMRQIDSIDDVIKDYPAYFRVKLDEILGRTIVE